jgi:hypothetical protein
VKVDVGDSSIVEAGIWAGAGVVVEMGMGDGEEQETNKERRKRERNLREDAVLFRMGCILSLVS